VIRTLIVDDETPARRKLQRLLTSHADIEVIGEAASGDAAIELAQARQPALVFLDIQMPGSNGLDVAAEIGTAGAPYIVFVTAHSEHAVQAFELMALDYLLKPVTPTRLASTLMRVRERLVTGVPSSSYVESIRRIATLLAPATQYLTRVLVSDERKSLLLDVNRIDFIEADRNYVRIHVGTLSYSVRASIGGLAKKLDPSRFLQINRSQIVRMDCIAELHPWSHGDYQVVLTNGRRLMWSRRYRSRSRQEFSPGV